jgi:hypothetical protein
MYFNTLFDLFNLIFFYYLQSNEYTPGALTEDQLHYTISSFLFYFFAI